MAVLWALIYGGCAAGAVCLARKLFLALPLQGRRFWCETLAAAALGLGFGWLACLRVGGAAVAGLRLALALAALVGAGRCDAATRKIPNLFAAALVAGAVVCTALDGLLQPDRFLPGLLGGGVIYLLLRLCRFISHGGIGGGDIKLMAALGCLLGLYGGFGVLLFAQLAAVAAVLVLLALHKVTLKDSIPFAPFFCLGLCITVWLGCF